MAASIAAYASQFINRNNDPSTSHSSESSQPLFYSFTDTDNGSHLHYPDQDDLDDMDDPHLRQDNDSDDPYLRLDEEADDDDEEFPAGASRHSLKSSAMYGSSRASGGWLAHHDQQAFPPSEPDTESNSSLTGSPGPIRLAPSPPPRTYNHISLVESQHEPLQARPIFSLPDTRYPYKQPQRHNDSIWTSLWLASLTFCLVFTVILLFTASKPSHSIGHLPYTTLLHTVPLLSILTVLSALVAYGHIYVLRMFVRPVMLATSIFIPATLLISSVWAFIGSFMWEDGKEPTWGESTGLRLFSLVPLALFFLTFHWFSNQNIQSSITKASALLTLTTNVLFMSNPLLLVLSPIILLASLLISIPFVTLIFRLLLIGYFDPIPEDGGPVEWHIRAWADWAIVVAVGVWLWTWGVARGVLRVTCAGVIGAWYFANLSLPERAPFDTHVIHSAFHRSTHTSLGTSALSALIMSGLRLLSLLSSLLRVLPLYAPFHPIIWICSYLLGYVEAWITGPGIGGGQGALVYSGLSGDGFWSSRGRVGALSAIPSQGTGRYAAWRRKGSYQTPLPLAFLSVFPLTLTFPFALLTYLFVAHTLRSPNEAWGAALLAGGVTALVGRFCQGVITDAADTLWICYLIDKEEGARRREEVFVIFNDDRFLASPPTSPRQTATIPTFLRSNPLDAIRGVGPRLFPLTGPTESHELAVSPPSSPLPRPTKRQYPSAETVPHPSTSQSLDHRLELEETEVDPFEPAFEEETTGSRHSSMTMKQYPLHTSEHSQEDHDDDDDDDERMFPSGFLN